MPETLDLSNVINISILSTQSGLALPNINTIALFSKETPVGGWSIGQEFKIYTNTSDVITDFGSSSKAAALAQSVFAQQPNPLQTNGYFAVVLINTGISETLPAAITRVINKIYFFGILIDEELLDADLALAATAVQAIDKLLFYASSVAAKYAPGGALDLIRTAGETHTRALYYKGPLAIDTQRMSAAYAGRGLSTDFSGANTTQTLHLKTLAGITPDQTVDQTALIAVQAAGVDVYVSIAGVSSLFTSGKNMFFDEIYNEFWFKFALQVAGFNYLRQTNSKIPQTPEGVEGLKNQYRRVCAQAIRNQFVGPGEWNSSTVFGNPEDLLRNIRDVGYYVFALPVGQQSQADREARKAPLIQIAVKTQGAIHSSNVIVNVNL